MNTILLTQTEHNLRLDKIFTHMNSLGASYGLVSTNTNIYYLTGRVFNGAIFLDAINRRSLCLVRRPNNLDDAYTCHIPKIENIPAAIGDRLGIELCPDETVALELDSVPYSTVMRMTSALGNPKVANLSKALRAARAVKTQQELAQLRISAAKHAEVYQSIPGMFSEGMTDLDLQIAIENRSRIEGCLGQFRISGNDMELYMGNILAGDNADAPSPYDFAMGGAGQDPSLPVGADGTTLRPGMSVMVDINGNYTGYMTDMTRTFSVGEISSQAMDAHNLSIAICRSIEEAARPGVEAKALYQLAISMVEQHGMEKYFMGHRQQAGFIGHGIGIEVNESPVIAPRSRDILCEGNVIALEPKFVIPGTGAVGIENTYVVTNDGLEQLTVCDEQIINLL